LPATEPLFVLQQSELLQSLQVSPTVKRSLQPNLDETQYQSLTQKNGCQAKDVRVGVASGVCSRHVVMAEGSPHPRKLVGRDRHADSRPTQENSSLGFPAAYLASNFESNVGIIDWATVAYPDIRNLVPELLEYFDQPGFDMVAVVTGTNDDTHGSTSLSVLSPRLSARRQPLLLAFSGSVHNSTGTLEQHPS
jgi:hypothetical protein